MSGTYDFAAKLRQGQRAEDELDRYFAARYQITPATTVDQRRGIDRFFYNPITGNRFAVEYKSDARTGQTGNVFIETKTFPDREQSGWAYTSQANWLFYHLPDLFTVYVVSFEYLRKRLPEWAKQYPIRSAQNATYSTYGLIVPLDEFKRCASETFDLRKELT